MKPLFHIRRRKVLRPIAVFLLLNTFYVTFLPTISYALTSGPSQSEFTAYESPGASDMVNLATGDFSFTTPLLEVPGPEGGFSLPLSYHAAPQVEEQASWVGLGWSMNPGAIARSLSQYPDDASGDLAETKNYNEGVRGWKGGIPGIVNMGWNSETGHAGAIDLIGLVGYGWGGATGRNVDIVGINFSSNGASVDPVKLAMAAFTIGTMGAGGEFVTAAKAAASIGMQVGMGVGMAAFQNKSMSSSAGFSEPTQVVKNGMVDFVTTAGLIGLIRGKKKYFHQDYWVFLKESRTEQMYGSLYFQEADDHLVDIYNAKGPNIYTTSTTSYKAQGFQNSYTSSNAGNYSFDAGHDVAMHLNSTEAYTSSNRPVSIAHDYYSVMGAGVSGSIRPQRLEVGSTAFPKRMGAEHIKYNAVPFLDNYKVNFRYEGSVANGYDYHKGLATEGAYKMGVTSSDADWASQKLQLTDNVLWKADDRTEDDRYGLKDRRLTTGRHIDWYTNAEIGAAAPNSPMDKGLFLEFQPPVSYSQSYSVPDSWTCDADGNNCEQTYKQETVTGRNKFRFERPTKGIGGFVITAEDGTTYHYSLPVYNFKQISIIGTPPFTQSYSSQKMDAPYATTWLLTAITGSDYVDRGGSGGASNGLLDEQDWGYWVKLDYGRFSSGYKWRSPYAGYSYSDEDNQFQSPSYSEGFKETYYLNSITTRSHTALFIKDVRKDGRAHYNPANANNATFPTQTEQYPASSLKLDEIILLSNQDYQKLTTANGIGANIPALGLNTNGNASSNDAGNLKNGDSFSQVLDKYDVNANAAIRAFLNERALKRVVFNYTYELANGTINSFESAVTPPAISNTNLDANYAARLGKLTLKSYAIYGPQNTKLMPDFLMEYGFNPDYHDAKWDGWGMYSSAGQRNNTASHKASSLDQDGTAWSLTKVTTPLGGMMQIGYERDTYSTVSGLSGSSTTLRINATSGGSGPYPSSSFTATAAFSGDLRNHLKIGDKVYVEGKVNNTFTGGGANCNTYQSPWFYSGIYQVANVGTNSVSFSTAPPMPNQTIPTGCYIVANTSEVTITVPNNTKGGNLRVASITSSDELGNQYKTRYLYNKYSLTEPLSSGVISKEPAFITTNEYMPELWKLEMLHDYPSTPVMYSKVTVLNGKLSTDADFDTRTEFIFTPPDASMITQVDENAPSRIKYNAVLGKNEELLMSNQVLSINTSRIGQIQSISKYNNKGVQEHSTAFTYSGMLPNNADRTGQGIFTEGVIISELFSRTNDYAYKLNRTTKQYIPSVLVSTTTKANNLTSTTTQTGFDFYTGRVLKSEYLDALGIKYRSETIPAYTLGIYSAMGSKGDNIFNKNMLTQQAASYVYKVPTSGNPEVVSASIQTWKSNWGTYRYFDNSAGYYKEQAATPVWRKHESYVWDSPELNPGGTYKNFVDFNWTANANQNANWLMTGQTLQYDNFSKPLMSKDLNNNYSAQKMGYNQTQSLVSAGNARYTELAYSGAEEKVAVGAGFHFGGEVTGGEKQSSDYKHTGSYSLKLAGGEKGFTYSAIVGSELETGRTFHVSTWIHKNDKALANGKLYAEVVPTTGGTPTLLKEISLSDATVKQAGNWYLVDLFFKLDAAHAGKRLTVGCRNASGSNTTYVYFDDFRFHPIDAPITSYVYDPHTAKVTYVLDGDNFYTRYVYDAAGILIRTYQEVLGTSNTEKLVSEHSYHYARRVN